MKAGFSLFECLIVLVIIGILAAMVYPSYQHHIVKVHKHQAEIKLWNIAHDLEEHFVQVGHYDGFLLHEVNDAFYHYDLKIQNHRSYMVTATPNDSNVKDLLPACYVLQITPAGISCKS